jgi:LPXTG-motif cell wall-anchored protein
MKKSKKMFKRLAPKMLNLFIVLLMLFQPVGTPGIIAMAQEKGTADASVVASDPAPEAEITAVEVPKTEATAVEVPAVETPVAEDSAVATPVAEAPAVESNPASSGAVSTDGDVSSDTGDVTTNQANPDTQDVQGTIDPEAAATENTAVTEEVPAADASKDVWSTDGDKATTNDSVEKDVTYVAPQNDQVTVTFTKLPENPGTLSIEEITLTDEQINSIHALSDKAYDITSSMEDGTFEFNLTLPKPKDKKDVQVIFAENISSLEEAGVISEDNTKIKTDEVKISSDHFTIYVVTDSGFKSPTANSNSGWDHPERGYTSDNNRAVANSGNDIVQYYNFNFSAIPSNATINGIEVQVEGYSSRTNQTNRQADISLSWNNGDNYTTGSGVKTTNMPESSYTNTNEASRTFGGSNDTWNRTWSSSDFTNANFRLKLDATNDSADLNIDSVQVKIHYTTSVDNSGTLVVNKIVVNDNGGTAVVSDFSFSVNGESPITFETDGSNSLTRDPGNYSVTEPAVVGYTATYNNCSNVAVTTGNATTCTITNNDNPTPYVPVAGNVIQNPSFEDGSGDNADHWFGSSWGSNNAAFTIVPGHSGDRAGQVNITSYSDGDAKWVPETVSVSEGQYYEIAFWYKSSAPLEVDSLYNGTDWNNLATLSATSNWKEYKTDLLVSSGITSFQIMAIAASTGTFVTDDYSMVLKDAPVFGSGGMVSLTFDDGWQSFYDNGVPILNAAGFKATAYLNSQPIQEDWDDYMNVAEVTSLYNAGYDIGAHSSTHDHLVGMNATQLHSEINDNKTYLQSILPAGASVNSFAYPFGEFDETVVSAVKSAGFVGARTVEAGYNFTNTDLYKLKALEVDGSTTVDEVKGWIDTARAQKAWLVLLFHEVKNDGTCATSGEDSYCTDKSTLQAIIDYLKAQNMTVPTVAQGIVVMGGGAVPDTVAPTVVLSTTSTNPTKDMLVPVTATFSESVTDFVSAGITVTNGTISDFAGSDAVYTFNVTPTADGAITINIPAGVAHDAALNPNVAATELSLTIDTTAPVITIVQPDTTPAQSKTITASVTDGTLSMSVDAGSVCDDTLAFEAYADTTFNTEADNGKTVCYKSEDSLGNIAYSLSGAIAGIDMTAPTAPSDLLPDTGTPTSSTIQNWSWTVANDLNGIADYFYRIENEGGTEIVPTTSTGNINSVLTNLIEGIYNFFVKAQDVAGNQSVENSFNLLVDTTAPSITLLGDNPATVVVHSGTYADAGSIVSDIYGVGLTATVAGFVDTDTVGSYSLTFNATDPSGNVAAEVVRTVKVVDGEDPVITLLGDNPLTIQIHGVYTESGATVTDNYDNSLVASIDDSAIDIDQLGSYEVTYDAIDSNGNNADQKVRTVNVVDTIAPSTPTATPPAGDYMADQSVELSSTDNGTGLDKIYFTADGSDPDNTATEYVGAITVDKDMTIKAIAYDKVGNTSDILTAAYGIAPVISAETPNSVTASTATITWITDDPATSRVVYDTVSHAALEAAPNYGYASSTVEADNSPKVTAHSVALTGLSAGTTYYYRTVSHGSPETVGAENSFTTANATASSSKKSSHHHHHSSSKDNDSNTTVAAGVSRLLSGIAAGAETAIAATNDVVSGGDAKDSGQVLGEEAAATNGQSGGSGTSSGWITWVVIIVLAGLGVYWWKRKKDTTKVK